MTTVGPSETIGRGPATLADFLDRLTHTIPELVAAICQHLSQEARRALHASCRAGRDAIRATTTTMSVQHNPEECHNQPCPDHKVPIHAPKQDLSITHPHLQHLKLCLNGQHTYLPTSLAISTPGVFQQLKSLTLCLSNRPAATAWGGLRQMVALCTQLSVLRVHEGWLEFVFKAPHNELLQIEDLDTLFQRQLFSRNQDDQLIATPAAQKYLTQAGQCGNHAVLEQAGLCVSSYDGFLLCSQLHTICIKSILHKPLRGMSALSQLTDLKCSVPLCPHLCALLQGLQDLPGLQRLHLDLVLKKDHEAFHMDGEMDEHPQPTSLHLAFVQHLELGFSFPVTDVRQIDYIHVRWPCCRQLMEATSAPQLTSFEVTNMHFPLPLMLEFASRHPALKRPGALSHTRFTGSGRELVEAAHQLPDVLNHNIRDLRDITAQDVVASVRMAAGTQLHHLDLTPKLDRYQQVSDVALDDSLLHLIAASCPNLTFLSLRNWNLNGITSHGVSAMASSLPRLEKLLLGKSRRAFDDICIRNLGMSCPLLSLLFLWDCHRVSEDAAFDLCTAATRLSTETLRLEGSRESGGFWPRVQAQRAAALAAQV